VAHAARESNAIEEFQYLDRPLAAESGAIAELGRTHLAVRGVEITCDYGELTDRGRGIEKIAHGPEHLAALRPADQRGTYRRLRLRRGPREFSHPRRIERCIEQTR